MGTSTGEEGIETSLIRCIVLVVCDNGEINFGNILMTTTIDIRLSVGSPGVCLLFMVSMLLLANKTNTIGSTRYLYYYSGVSVYFMTTIHFMDSYHCIVQ